MEIQYPLRCFVALCLLHLTESTFASDEASLSQLAWLSGCWSAEGSEAGSGEQWMPLAGASLLGMSRTVRKGKTVAYEFMRITRDSDGNLAFFAQPSGQPPARFPVRSMSDTEVIFENLDHDFPQQVIYRLAAPAQLRASIEGVRNGTVETIEFRMVRVSCDSQLTQPTAK